MNDMEQMRAALRPDDLRRLGIPVPIMSDFELYAAINRDERWNGNIGSDDMAAYDRRGLLNVVAVAANAQMPHRYLDLDAPETVERLADQLWRESRHPEIRDETPLYDLTTSTASMVQDHFEKRARAILVAIKDADARP